MRRVSFGTLLIGLNTGLVLLAVAALALSEPFARETAEQVGLPVDLLAAADAADRTEDPRLPLRAEVLATGEERRWPSTSPQPLS